MKALISVISMLLLSSCSALNPDFYKTVDDVATDGVIQVQIDKEAFQKQTDSVNVSVTVKNKE